ncbi:MAG: DJ-1/PfpI family protein [Desulfobacteraceae bacterium]|nr:MAG: DJ-1/PfpI family protein [Desulfobacteraceae bacterium]
MLNLFAFGSQAGSSPLARVVMVVAPQKLADNEYRETRAALEKSGAAVTVAGATLEICTGYGDIKVKPDILIDQVSTEEFEALIIIGGEGVIPYLWEHMGLRQLIKNAFTQNRVVAAICTAPVALARAGVLKGKTATVFADPEYIAELKAGGALYRDMPVAVDGNLVTGNGPEASQAFGAKVVGALLTRRWK